LPKVLVSFGKTTLVAMERVSIAFLVFMPQI
jgi:hypothetical protein